MKTVEPTMVSEKTFWTCLGIAFIFHALVICWLLYGAHEKVEAQYKPLAVMDFTQYDPDGGEGGGSMEEPAPLEAPPPEPEPEPEPETPKDLDVPEVITSTAPVAPPAPVAPVVKKKVEPKPKAKPKPKPKPKAKPKESTAAKEATAGKATPGAQQVSGKAGGQGYSFGKKAGGGPGKGKGGIGGGKGKGNPNLENSYKSKIRAKLLRLRKYPSGARSQRLKGTAQISFTVNRQGVVTSSRLARSSGQAIFDQEAMALLRRCSPFPAMPKNLTVNSMNLTVGIQFAPPR